MRRTGKFAEARKSSRGSEKFQGRPWGLLLFLWLTLVYSEWLVRAVTISAAFWRSGLVLSVLFAIPLALTVFLLAVQLRPDGGVFMEIKLTEKQFRRLLDLVYIGNWVLNSTRGDDRIRQYDQVESLIFSHCLSHGMAGLTELYQGEIIPSRAFAEGGIHEAIMAYEDNTFFEILAQELALRDMDDPPITEENYDEVMSRMDEYLGEFEQHGTDNITVDME